MIVFQVEEYADVIEEVKGLLQDHADELAVDKALPLKPNFDAYAKSAAAGSLLVVTARDQDALVGYHVTFLAGHLHYEGQLIAHVDLYYLKPAYRQGWAGVSLLRFVDATLTLAGVHMVFTTTTSDADKGAVLRRLGHKECERVYVKILGGNHEQQKPC